MRVALVLIVLLLLLVGAGSGGFAIVFFLFGEAELASAIPAFGVYLLGCVAAGLFHLARRGAGNSQGFRVPAVAWWAVGAAVSVVVGQALLAGRERLLFGVFFFLAASLPPLAALALASGRLGPITTWRRIMAGVVVGSLVSTHLTILVTGVVSLLVFALVVPLRDLFAQAIGSRSLEDIFFSPALMIVLAESAIVAPVVEEATKPLAAIILAKRLRGPAEAFLVGMAGGVGFAILENMLYAAAGGAGLWAGIATLRGIGGVLHPLNAGLVAMGWYGVRNGVPGAWGRLLSLYGLAVGAHALWNGGLAVLFSDIGSYFFAVDSWNLDVYGLGQPGVVIVFMLLEAMALWRLLVHVSDLLRDPVLGEQPTTPVLAMAQPRRLALWATGLMLVLAPLGALYGPLVARYAGRLVPIG
jgi:RsiW-degrading membrane proteinase PrsW (M82 family)